MNISTSISTLHSTMSLLNLSGDHGFINTNHFTFHNVSIKSAANDAFAIAVNNLYIPQCLY